MYAKKSHLAFHSVYSLRYYKQSTHNKSKIDKYMKSRSLRVCEGVSRSLFIHSTPSHLHCLLNTKNNTCPVLFQLL